MKGNNIRITDLPSTRPDTRPIPVADGWAGAEMRVFTFFNSWSRTDRPTNRPTDRPTNGRTDKASYRVACPQLKSRRKAKTKGKKFKQFYLNDYYL